MVALIVIWTLAALCGLAAASVWEPALRLTLALAETVDPFFADMVREIATIGSGADTAIGWVVALAIGIPLTALWLGFRMIGGLLRAPADRPRQPRPDMPSPARRSNGSAKRPHGSSVTVARPDRPSPATSPSESGVARPWAIERPGATPERPRTAPSSAPPSPPADAPRWGRQ